MGYRHIIDRTQTRLKQILTDSHFAANLKRDQELLWRLRGQRRLPDFRQLKYIAKIYSPLERLITKIAAAIILLALMAEGANLYFYHQIITPAAGGEYVEAAIGSPSVVNPLFASGDSADADLAALIFSSLLKTDEQGKLVPDLAEKYALDDKRTTYTFTVRKGVKWHDNEPLTTEDVLFTAQSIKDPNFKSPLYGAFRDVQVKIINEQTVSFTLPQPYAPFPTLLTFGILPQHLWQEIEPKNAILAELNLKPTGSGPYRFVSFSKDKKGSIHEYKLTRFADYYGPGPFIQNLTLKFFAEPNEAAEAIISGNADGFGFLPGAISLDESARLGKSDKRKLALGLPQYTALFFNQEKNPLLADKAVRQALALAIDRQMIVKEIFDDNAQAINAPIQPGMIGYDAALSEVKFDPEQAAKLLDDAGWKRAAPKKASGQKAARATSSPDTAILNEGEYQRTKSVKKTAAGGETKEAALTVKLTMVQKENNAAVAEKIAAAWKKIGISVAIEPVNAESLQTEVVKPRNYEILLFGQILGRDPDPYSFWHSSQIGASGFNLAGYNNKEVDKLLVSARSETDESKRQAQYQEFQKKLLADYPAVILYALKYDYLLPDKIKGANPERVSQPGDRFANINKWYIKTKKKIDWLGLWLGK